jgi:hypothetical protein
LLRNIVLVTKLHEMEEACTIVIASALVKGEGHDFEET